MKRAVSALLTAIYATVILLAGCKTAAPPPELMETTPTVDLFNGTNLDGWTFCMKNNADPAQTWSVRDGVIHCTGQPYGYVRTMQNYHDYQLTVIWRFVKVAPRADNSGIFVHIQRPDSLWPECVQVQGLFQHQGDLFLMEGASADGYQPASKKSIFIPQMGQQNENPAGEWNTNEIICNGSTIGVFVNGKAMNQITGCTLTSGYIGIQSEGGDIEVRRLLLEPLK
jgi:Domain of Unknown Function (DUF1080)